MLALSFTVVLTQVQAAEGSARDLLVAVPGDLRLGR
jgi:hypothetical protein